MPDSSPSSSRIQAAQPVGGQPLAGQPPQPRIPGRAVSSPARIAHNVTISGFLIAALYYGREMLVPLALAILLSFVLAPLVRLLRRWHLGRVPPVLAAVALAFAIILGLAGLIGSQVTFLAERLPEYEGTLREKIQAVKGSTGEGLLGRVSGVVRDLASEITGGTPEKPPAAPATAAPATPSRGAAPPPPEPVPVKVTGSPDSPLDIVGQIIAPLLGPLGAGAMVLIFTIFILLQREDLRDRLIRLLGVRDLQRTTNALDDAAERLSRYFTVQSAINASFGVIIGTGLWWIGVPNPALWGIIAALLRFLPYIGAPLAALFPAMLAIAVAPGWSMFFWTIGLFAVVEPIVGQLIEPLLYGHSTGLSSLAVVLSAAFWTLLWGPIGLLLSTPLTVCLVVLGRHVERLEFLDVLLGDRPPLTPAQSFYQRLLAGNLDEAVEQAESFLREHSLADYYDEVVLKGLALARRDAARFHLDEGAMMRLRSSVKQLIAELAEPARPPSETTAGPPLPGEPVRREPVLCIATRTPIDAAACDLESDLLAQQGMPARTLEPEEVTALTFARLDAGRPEVICLSYFGTDNLSPPRLLIRRLRRRYPEARILLGMWCLESEGARNQALATTGADAITTTLRETIAYLSVTGAGGAATERAASAPRQATG
jgi:predicted PurR-regulated permease PerM